MKTSPGRLHSRGSRARSFYWLLSSDQAMTTVSRRFTLASWQCCGSAFCRHRFFRLHSNQAESIVLAFSTGLAPPEFLLERMQRVRRSGWPRSAKSKSWVDINGERVHRAQYQLVHVNRFGLGSGRSEPCAAFCMSSDLIAFLRSQSHGSSPVGRPLKECSRCRATRYRQRSRLAPQGSGSPVCRWSMASARLAARPASSPGSGSNRPWWLCVPATIAARALPAFSHSAHVLSPFPQEPVESH